MLVHYNLYRKVIRSLSFCACNCLGMKSLYDLNLIELQFVLNKLKNLKQTIKVRLHSRVAFCRVRIFEQNKINISGLDASNSLTLPRLRHFLPRDFGVIMVSNLKCCLLTHVRHSFAGM